MGFVSKERMRNIKNLNVVETFKVGMTSLGSNLATLQISTFMKFIFGALLT